MEAAREAELADILRAAGAPHAKLGVVTALPRLIVRDGEKTLIDANINELRSAWRDPLNTIL